jgi:N utilization substance protein A
MMRLTIDNDTFRYLNAFGTLTGVSAIDCFDQSGEIIYIVEPGKIGVAVGKGGSNIKKVEEIVKKRIRLVEYSSDPITFIRNAVYPLKVPNIYISTKSSGEKVLNMKSDAKLKKTLMREGRKMMKLLSSLVARQFPSFKLEVVQE